MAFESDRRWGMTVESGSNGGTVFRSVKGELLITEEKPGYVTVQGEVRLGRWDGRQKTLAEEFDFNKFRPAHEPQYRDTEIASWRTPKTFFGRGAKNEAKYWAWEQLTVVPITVPFNVAKARDTGEGERDWQKLLSVLAQELKFMRNNREPNIATFETLATDALNWDRKSPLQNEEELQSLYNERVLRSG